MNVDTASSANRDPGHALQLLADCRAPFLIGVRHHSAAMARVIPQLLDSLRPAALLIEMPPEFTDWLPFLSHRDLETPVALAACSLDQQLWFYPLADFSPELVAIRWAAANDVPVIPCDMPLSSSVSLPSSSEVCGDRQSASVTPLGQLLRRMESDDSSELWDRLVESPAIGSTAESVRRAALLFGWLVRSSASEISIRDRQREAAMRQAILDAPAGSAALIGAFHAAALLPEPMLWSLPELDANGTNMSPEPPITSLVPYSFAQLDQRSGYPAGVKDPAWHQAQLATDSCQAVHDSLSDFAVRLCRELRRQGHVAGTPEAREIVRMAAELGQLRGTTSGRTELLEAVQSCLVQGDLFGRGRAVAAAAEKIFVGNRSGKLAAHTPRSGLAPEIENTLQRLKLPYDGQAATELKELRLDPLRSKLDRSRAVVLRRLSYLGVHYGKLQSNSASGDLENLTEVWRIQWTHASVATLANAARWGVTLKQAASGAISSWSEPDSANGGDGLQVALLVKRLQAATDCGLPDLVRSVLGQLEPLLLTSAMPDQLLEAAHWMRRMALGHFPGLPLTADQAALPDVSCFENAELLDPSPLVAMALRRLDGLRGSDQLADVNTIVDLACLVSGEFDTSVGTTRKTAWTVAALCRQFVSWLKPTTMNGSPLMQGAAWGILAMLGEVQSADLSALQVSWFDAAHHRDARDRLTWRLVGMLVPLLPMILAESEWLAGLANSLAVSSDDNFLSRLPALRRAFDSLSPAERSRLLVEFAGHFQTSPTLSHLRIEQNPLAYAAALSADRKGRLAVSRAFPDWRWAEPNPRNDASPTTSDNELHEIAEEKSTAISHQIPIEDRWRLVLGVKGCRSGVGCVAAKSLDQLYGRSAREGQGDRSDLAAGAGSESRIPTAREWVDELQAVFDADVCEEVLGEAAVQGRTGILEFLDSDSVRASVSLLEQILALHGALPEQRIGTLRKLARRITSQLAQQLAVRLRPALTGISTPKPTGRRTRQIDLARTIRQNLKTARRTASGAIKLLPEAFVFRTPARRQMDWHLIFVVDVSGSMEASVIYSALLAAIFAGLPALDVRFFAFSTEVVDFSGVVEDPLSLLLEVEVGGGTRIGLGLKAARDAIRNPARTMVVLVTDFEEGVSTAELLSEVRALADSGTRLIGLAALDDQAVPRYDVATAQQVVAAGMPVAAVSPERLAQWVGDQMRGARS